MKNIRVSLGTTRTPHAMFHGTSNRTEVRGDANHHRRWPGVRPFAGNGASETILP